jgi:hypothetical protein
MVFPSQLEHKTEIAPELLLVSVIYNNINFNIVLEFINNVDNGCIVTTATNHSWTCSV